MNKMTCIYPGSFDPMTYGHLDIINRAAAFSDKLIIAVLQNLTKKPLFSVDERIEILQEAATGIGNVEIDSFSGLLADYAKQRGTNLIVRGLRGFADFEYEFQMAQTNRLLSQDLETLFITADTKYLFLGSGGIKEVAAHGGDISKMAPPSVVDRIIKKFNDSDK